VVKEGVISNPKVGWAGYSIKLPDGIRLLDSASDEDESARAEEFRRWYDRQSARYGWDWYTRFSDRFLMEDVEDRYIISFISDTFELPSSSWSSMSSVETRYIIQKMINRKMVVINDMQALHEQVELNGQRGWYISGLSRPYFKKKINPQAYEGYFILGRLREAFWIEGFGDVDARDELKDRVRTMAESLKVY
jgi:hypothetical protein